MAKFITSSSGNAVTVEIAEKSLFGNARFWAVVLEESWAQVYEAAALDGAHGLKMHLKITLPLISPSMFFVVVLSFVNALKIFKESFLYYNTNYPPDPAYMIQNYCRWFWAIFRTTCHTRAGWCICSRY